MKYGKQLDWFLSLEEAGTNVPALDTKPELISYLSNYWNAFMELSSSRQMGFGSVGSIIYSEISAYLDENRLFDLDDRKQYRKYINILDSEFLKHSNNKEKQNVPKEIQKPSAPKKPVKQRGRKR